MNTFKGFASDNNSGASPEVLTKMNEVNRGHTIGYGDDPYTKLTTDIFATHFGQSCRAYLVFTGTAANVLGITQASESYHAILCAETAHIYEDECGSPEKFSGCKLVPIKTNNGKLTPALIKPYLIGFGFEHRSQPKIISISQPTEMGTLYTIDEIRQISTLAREYGLFVHMDGARLANAAVALNEPFANFTTNAGVDILSFGGTKNGLIAAESILFLNDNVHVDNFKYVRKQGMQLSSKMRFIAAQFLAYFENDLWQKNASHANNMAQKLYHKVKNIKGVTITQPVEANAVFATIPKHAIEQLKEKYFFYTWNEEAGEVRWMCSFDTTEDEIDSFTDLLKKLLH